MVKPQLSAPKRPFKHHRVGLGSWRIATWCVSDFCCFCCCLMKQLVTVAKVLDTFWRLIPPSSVRQKKGDGQQWCCLLTDRSRFFFFFSQNQLIAVICYRCVWSVSVPYTHVCKYKCGRHVNTLEKRALFHWTMKINVVHVFKCAK